MERNSACGASVSHGKNSTESCSSCGLRNDVSRRLVITSDSMWNNSDYPVEYADEEEEDEFSEEELLAQMGYGKRYSPNRQTTEEHQNLFNREEEDLSDEYLKKEPLKHKPIMSPSAIQDLVSALKGSREKQGKPTRECRVSWAPDVYDPPPPSSDEHLEKPSTERRKNEHKVKQPDWKNRQKTGGNANGGVESGEGGAKQGSTGGGRKAGFKDKGKKQMKKKHGGRAAKFSNLDD